MPDAANCRLLHRHEKFFCRRKMVKGPSGALKLSEVSGEPSQGVDEEGMAEVLLKLRTLHKIVPSLTPPFSLLPEQIQILKEVADDLYRDTRHFLLNRQPSCVSSPNPDPESMAVFRKFYGMDFYITGASNYGCDFLLYKGDPLCFHAEYLVWIIRMNRETSFQELVCKGRLARNVNKILVIAWFDDSGNVVYNGLDWTGWS
ncbi:MAG: hypothetical protein SGCHY_002825 [Lobulomycetales sp.]